MADERGVERELVSGPETAEDVVASDAKRPAAHTDTLPPGTRTGQGGPTYENQRGRDATLGRGQRGPGDSEQLQEREWEDQLDTNPGADRTVRPAGAPVDPVDEVP